VSDLEKELREILVQGANKMNIALAEPQVSMLLSYIREFDKWNKAYNLSAIRDIRQMVARHLLDSLSVVPYFLASKHSTKNVIDVGTGGGLPGIPLAIMFPEKKFTLLDSAGKKNAFFISCKNLIEIRKCHSGKSSGRRI